MGKIIRPSYSVEVSIGLLLLIFGLSGFLAFQLFDMSGPHLNEGKNVYFGVFLISLAVIVMFIVLWEELLFPIKVKSVEGGVEFRNHRSKLIKQILIYCSIPLIFVFIYIEYEVNLIRFIIWASVCILGPVVGRLISGIKNYNDFLKLTNDAIEYRNNDKVGIFDLKNIQQIVLIKDDRKILHKVQLATNNNEQVTIDLDEMEIEAFYVTIDDFITTHYKSLVKV